MITVEITECLKDRNPRKLLDEWSFKDNINIDIDVALLCLAETLNVGLN